MLKLMVGNNFDEKFIDYIIEENKKYNDVKINEVFGSARKLNVIQTARPDFRVPDVDLYTFKYLCKKLYDADIIINYTINTPIVNHLEINVEEYRDFVKKLYDEYYVRRITVAHPLIIKILGEEFPEMKIELSTIFKLKHPRQLEDLKKFNPSLNKICVDVFRNRDYLHLKDVKKTADDLEIDIELITNEFCIYECAVRDQCYHAHILNKTVEDTRKFKNWPMGYCINKRETEPIEWLFANFILPQQMKMYYEEFGIEHFKITGRTAPTPYAKWITTQYLKQNHSGNLLELWQDVKNISRVARGKEDYLDQRNYIETDLIDEDFLKWYFTEDKHSYEAEKLHVKEYFNKSFKRI